MAEAPRTDLVEALLWASERDVRGMLSRLAQEHDRVDEFFHDTLAPALQRVGELWATQAISVADEHRATQRVRDFLGYLKAGREHERPVDAHARTAVVACAQGEEHEVGARVLADALDLRGWNVHYLGANVPVRDLAAYVARHGADALFVAVSTAPQLHALRVAVRGVRESCGDACPLIVVGGRPFVADPALVAAVGADVHGVTVPHAVDAVEEQLTRRRAASEAR